MYYAGQLIDISLWSWLLLIMIKRVICRGFDIRLNTIVTAFKQHSFISITREKLHNLIKNHHYYSEILILIASALMVISISNDLYLYSHNLIDKIQTLDIFKQLVFSKLISIGLIFKFRRSQPKLFSNIKEEIKDAYNKIVSPFSEAVH